jgi:hypothetical protein
MAATSDRQLASFIAKFAPPMQAMIRSCRAAMRKRFPTAYELVYDNYNFLVIAYCTTERPSDSVASLAANAKGIGLHFYRGATLADPQGVLQGSGSQNRFVRLESAATLSRPAIRSLLAAAAAQADTAFRKTGAAELIIRAVSPKQRPRR